MLAGSVVSAGYGTATALPTFDFETASAAGYHWDGEKWRDLPGAAKNKRGLKVTGRRVYVKHPSFRVLSLAYDLLDGQGLRYWYPGCQPPQDLLDYIASGGLIEAWNAGFEFDVWNEFCVPTYGWPVLKLEQLRCAMAKARAHAMPGKLETFGDVANLSIKKDKDGARLLKLFSTPRNPTKKDQRVWVLPHEDPANFAKLLSYNGTDVLTETEASLRTPDLSADELQFWMVDQRINLRGIQVDVVALDNCVTVLEQAYAKYNAEIRALTNGAVQAASELEQIKKWLNTRGMRVDSLAEEALDALVSDMKASGNIGTEYRVLQIRQLLGSASVKKLFAFRHQNHMGRLYDLYSYFAARTGRWTGNGPQPQNLPSGLFHTLEEVERALGVIAHRCLELVEYHYPGNTALEVIGSVLRGLLIAAPGHELICSDFTAIEGVVTAALSGEAWALDVFHTHGLIYEATAAKIAKIPFDEFVKHRLDTGGKAEYVNGRLMHIDGGKHHPLRKKLGKFGVLASGFGGWIPAWKNFGADEFLTDDEIKQAILAWRDANPNTVELWGGQSRGRYQNARPDLFGLEGAAIAAVRYPGRAFNPASNPSIVYQMSAADDILYCKVPSGGYLTYHRPRLSPAKREWQPPWEVSLSYEGDNKNPQMGPLGWIRMDLYGGKQMENIVQKEARYIHATGLVNLDRAGYRPVLHSHDEPCGEVPMGFGTIEHFESLMTEIAHRPGSFCYGWPIKAKGGWRGPRYGKFD